MQAFIERFSELVDDWLRDPQTSRRLSRDKRLRDLFSTQVDLFEIWQRESGQESMINESRSTVVIRDGQEFYALPGSFRNFISFKLHDESDQSIVRAEMGTVPIYDSSPGIQILDAQRGFRIQPIPRISSDQRWTLTYQKGPVKLHYAKADGITERSIGLGIPGQGCGERIETERYYDGSCIRVFSADTGYPQTREIEYHNAKSGACFVRVPWMPLPTGEVWYEIAPEVPEEYDSVYALAVAIQNASRRRNPDQRKEIEIELVKKMAACRSYWASNTKDRAPQRIIKTRTDAIDPYDQYYPSFW